MTEQQRLHGHGQSPGRRRLAGAHSLRIRLLRQGALSSLTQSEYRCPSSRVNGDTVRGTSSLDWERAKHAARAAWNRLSESVERALPGDADRDGK